MARAPSREDKSSSLGKSQGVADEYFQFTTSVPGWNIRERESMVAGRRRGCVRYAPANNRKYPPAKRKNNPPIIKPQCNFTMIAGESFELLTVAYCTFSDDMLAEKVTTFPSFICFSRKYGGCTECIVILIILCYYFICICAWRNFYFLPANRTL